MTYHKTPFCPNDTFIEKNSKKKQNSMTLWLYFKLYALYIQVIFADL
jgi:hypothetical protein